MKIKLSKSQWEFIGKETGWIKQAQIFGPGAWERYNLPDTPEAKALKEKYNKPVTTNIIIDNSPLILSPYMADDSLVVIVEHNGEHIGVFDPTLDGFNCTYTKHLEKYSRYKKAIDIEAQKIINNYQFPREEKSAKSIKITKISDSRDIYRSIRKKMPPPTMIMDDGRIKSRIKDIGGDSDTDIPDIDVLKDEANTSTTLRGHLLGNWNDFKTTNQIISINHCLVCGKEVVVNTRPKPNEIDIGGEAVAMDCKDSTETAESLQAKLNGLFVRIAMVSLPPDPVALDMAIRTVSKLRLQHGSITMEQFHEQGRKLKESIMKLPKGKDKDRIISLFNGVFSYNKIEPERL